MTAQIEFPSDYHYRKFETFISGNEFDESVYKSDLQI